MEMDQSLAKQSNAPLTTVEQSWKHCLGRMLTQTAQLMGKELTSGEVRLWEQLLVGRTEAAIEAAFAEHIKHSTFFPRPAEILVILGDLYRENVQKKLAEDTDRSLREARENRKKLEAAGEPSGLAQYTQLMAKLVKVVDDMGGLAHKYGLRKEEFYGS
jgi:hypothetical protein